MKKTLSLSLIGIFLIAAFSSCSMEKRQYSSGYHIQWNNQAKNDIKNKDKQTETVVIAENKVQPVEEIVPADLLEATETAQTETIRSESSIAPLELASSSAETITILPNDVNRSLNSSNQSISIDSKSSNLNQKESVRKNSIAQKAQKPKAAKGGDKSWVVALVLCIFLGGLGIHRFYLGYPGLGILMLFTGGVFGILWIIDLIRIITKSLKPKDGNYN